MITRCPECDEPLDGDEWFCPACDAALSGAAEEGEHPSDDVATLGKTWNGRPWAVLVTAAASVTWLIALYVAWELTLASTAGAPRLQSWRSSSP